MWAVVVVFGTLGCRAGFDALPVSDAPDAPADAAPCVPSIAITHADIPAVSDLTTLGTKDWQTHLGTNNDRKVSVSPLIFGFTLVGGGGNQRTNVPMIQAYSWSDGTNATSYGPASPNAEGWWEVTAPGMGIQNSVLVDTKNLTVTTDVDALDGRFEVGWSGTASTMVVQGASHQRYVLAVQGCETGALLDFSVRSNVAYNGVSNPDPFVGVFVIAVR